MRSGPRNEKLSPTSSRIDEGADVFDRVEVEHEESRRVLRIILNGRSNGLDYISLAVWPHNGSVFHCVALVSLKPGCSVGCKKIVPVGSKCHVHKMQGGGRLLFLALLNF